MHFARKNKEARPAVSLCLRIILTCQYICDASPQFGMLASASCSSARFTFEVSSSASLPPGTLPWSPPLGKHYRLKLCNRRLAASFASTSRKGSGPIAETGAGGRGLNSGKYPRFTSNPSCPQSLWDSLQQTPTGHCCIRKESQTLWKQGQPQYSPRKPLDYVSENGHDES